MVAILKVLALFGLLPSWLKLLLPYLAEDIPLVEAIIKLVIEIIDNFKKKNPNATHTDIHKIIKHLVDNPSLLPDTIPGYAPDGSVTNIPNPDK